MTTDTFNTASDLQAIIAETAEMLGIFPVDTPDTVTAQDISTFTASIARIIAEGTGSTDVSDAINTVCLDFYTDLKTAIETVHTDKGTAFSAL